MQEIKPLDRLIACLSYLVLGKKGPREVLDSVNKRHRKDSEVMERLQVLQVMCLTEPLGNFYIAGG